jgi:class 3 adenylate cyclase
MQFNDDGTSPPDDQRGDRVNGSRPPIVPLHRAIIAVDVERSTTRTNPARARLRHALYELLEEALRRSGIAEHLRDPSIDRGDGVLVLVHPSDNVPKTLLLNTLIPALAQLLVHHNRRSPDNAFRLRAAVHAGEIHYDQQGLFGEAVDLTCRLLDAPELKAVLAKSSRPLALAVSDDLYRSIVKHGYDNINDRAFEPLTQFEFAGHPHRGWVHKP